MFVWSKLSSVNWADAWEERFSGDPRAVMTRLAGKTTIRVELYCERKREADAVKQQFGGRVREIKNQNWAAMNQELPPPVKVRDRLLVVAEKGRGELAALRKANPKRQVISIPPDMAFGTGHHATTATVLRMLVDFAEERAEKPWTMLDLGTGSGLLAIAAEKLGATKAWGCDFDPLAVKVAHENLRRNGTENVALEVADVLQWKPKEKWDCVAANLFHDVLEAAFPKLVRSLKRDGALFISGILRTQAESCLDAGRRAGLEFDHVVSRGKWVTARGRLDK
ncbi:MAG: 50S ribosomal protein L11 methyltransferase [Roseimicrobium sp.]